MLRLSLNKYECGSCKLTIDDYVANVISRIFCFASYCFVYDKHVHCFSSFVVNEAISVLIMLPVYRDKTHYLYFFFISNRDIKLQVICMFVLMTALCIHTCDR